MIMGDIVFQSITRVVQVKEFIRDNKECIENFGLFDPSFYKEQVQSRSASIAPLLHYILRGHLFNCRPHRDISERDLVFDWHYYRSSNISPIEAYWNYGRFQGADFRSRAYRQKFRNDQQISFERGSNGVLCIHAFYFEELKLILEYAKEIDVDVVVTTSKPLHEFSELLSDKGKSIKIISVANHGRDIFPFVQLVNAGLLDAYQFVIKIHTKRSLHRPDGAEWLKNSVSSLMGANVIEGVRKNLTKSFLLAPDGLLGGDNYLEANYKYLQWLSSKSGTYFDPLRLRFASGSMFIATSNALRPIKNLNLSAVDFESECGQLDGTLAHAMERFIGYAALQDGATVTELSKFLS